MEGGKEVVLIYWPDEPSLNTIRKSAQMMEGTAITRSTRYTGIIRVVTTALIAFSWLGIKGWRTDFFRITKLNTGEREVLHFFTRPDQVARHLTYPYLSTRSYLYVNTGRAIHVHIPFICPAHQTITNSRLAIRHAHNNESFWAATRSAGLLPLQSSNDYSVSLKTWIGQYLWPRVWSPSGRDSKPFLDSTDDYSLSYRDMPYEYLPSNFGDSQDSVGAIRKFNGRQYCWGPAELLLRENEG